jgi:hypothetical protein
VLNGGAGQAPDPGFVVRNNTLVQANWTTIPGSQYAIDDQIYRPDAQSETKFINLDGEWRASDRLRFTGQIGDSKGSGETPTQAVFEGDILNTGAAFRLHGTGRPADGSVPNGNPAVFTGAKLDWIFGASPGSTEDEEKWGQIDGAFALDSGAFTNFKFGSARRTTTAPPSTSTRARTSPTTRSTVANLPAWNGETYPSDYADGIGGNFPRNVWQLDPQVLEDWGQPLREPRPGLAPLLPRRVRPVREERALLRDGGHGRLGLDRERGCALREHRRERAAERADRRQRVRAVAPCNVPGRHRRFRVRLVLQESRGKRVRRVDAERELQVRPQRRGRAAPRGRAHHRAAGLQRARRRRSR